MTSSVQRRLVDAYAKVAVEAGLALAPGQTLFVYADLEHAPLAQAVARAAYARGADYVDAYYWDPQVLRALMDYGPATSYGMSPPWLVSRFAEAVACEGAVLWIQGRNTAEDYEGIDAAKVAAVRMSQLVGAHHAAILGRLVNWTAVPCPTPIPDSLEVADARWRGLATALRLDESDPVSAWNARLDELVRRAGAVTSRSLDHLIFRGPRTALTVGLFEGARWLTARMATVRGQTFTANLPTEEIYSAPDPARTHGVVEITRPAVIRNRVVSGGILEFAAGRVVRCAADDGAELLNAEVATDDGAARLGEVALVDGASRVAKTGIFFGDIALDENAASHIALGAGDPAALDNIGQEPNTSRIHLDLCIGGPEVDVDGVDAAGLEEPILSRGRWVMK